MDSSIVEVEGIDDLEDARGMYQFPQGGIQIDELPYQAAIR